jgi:hypothetical protein
VRGETEDDLYVLFDDVTLGHAQARVFGDDSHV